MEGVCKLVAKPRSAQAAAAGTRFTRYLGGIGRSPPPAKSA